MGKPGAKKMDQIVSVTPGDVHIIMVPSPGGPVPTPIPHPCASMIKDKVATKVKVMGQPGAVKGSKSKHTPPHIPMGPGPFQKPPKNEGEIITGSANVFYEGKEAAMLGDTGKMCSDPSDTPVGKVIGTAATVLVGGGGGGSDEAREKASADAMKAASAACHKWINANMPPGADQEKAHRDVCTATGHPIDVATGKLFTRSVELRLRGRLPLEFVRNYSSARPDRGPFGIGWRFSHEVQLFVHDEFIAHRDANGRYLAFEPIAIGGSSRDKLSRCVLSRTAQGFVFAMPDGTKQMFDAKASFAGKDAILIAMSSLVDSYGNTCRFSYAGGRIVKVVDSAGRIVYLDYNERGLIACLRVAQKEGDEAAVVRSYEYSNDLLVAVRDATGAALFYEYVGHLLVRETDRTGFSFYFRYDSEGWCSETWGDGGIFYRHLVYDRHRRRTLVVNSLGQKTTYAWTEMGVVNNEIDPEGNAWTFDYNDSLQQVLVKDPLGRAWAYEYDERGLLLLGEDPEGNVFEYDYDDRGRIIKYTDRAGNKWEWDYASGDQGARMRGPLGYTTASVRDARGDQTRVAHRNGTFTRMKYSDRGDLIRISYAGGLNVWRTHTGGGDLETEHDQFGKRVEITYDRLGRMRSLQERDRGTQTFDRDAEGRVVAVTDYAGNRTEYQWCYLNKVRRIIFPPVELASGDTVRPIKEFDYDTESRLTAVRLPGGEVVSYEYATHLPHPTRVKYPDGRVQDVTRDPRGFITELRENGYLVYKQELDSAGRVLRRTTGDGDEVTYEYDPLGRLARAVGPDGGIQIDRDPLGRVTSETLVQGEVKFAYDDPDAFRRISIGEEFTAELAIGDKPGAIVVQIEGRAVAEVGYDVLGRLQSLSCWSQDNDESDGDAALGRQEWRYENSRLPAERIIIGPGAGSRRHDRYTYNDAALLVEAAQSGGPTHRYRRDALGRLTEAETDASILLTGGGDHVTNRTRWFFDAAGNRTRAEHRHGTSEGRIAPAPGHIEDREFASGNRLVKGEGIQLSYDTRGRVAERRETDGGITRFRWDALNRLREIVTPNGEAYRMSYDPLGRRTEVDGPSGVTQFLYSGKRLVYETGADGRRRQYFYDSGSFRPLLCFERPADADHWSVSSYVTDPRGCPEAQLGADGEMIWQATIDPWGRRVGSDGGNGEGASCQPLALPGQYLDQPDRLAYNYARYFMPDLGTYCSPDPTGLDGGDRAYAYAEDPICWIDPLGLAIEDYTPDPGLAAACGPVQPAWARRGEIGADADIRVAMPGHPMVLDTNETDRYLYVVGEDGTIYYSPQSPQSYGSVETVKHTTIAGPDPSNPNDPLKARPMRIGGEVNYDHDRGVWVMDGASGRYSHDASTGQVTRTPENVAAAAALNDSFGSGGTPIEPAPHVFPPRR